MRIYYIIVIFLISIGGCGNSPFKPSPIVNPIDDKPSGDVSSKDLQKKYIKYMEIIKERLGSTYVKAYPSTDLRDVYVIKQPSSYSYSLVDYDLSGSEPVVKKIIVSSYNNPITKVLPLPDNRLVYLVSLKMEKLEIHLYDVILGEETAWFWIFDSYYNTTGESYLDPSGKYLTLGRTYVDITDIHKPLHWTIANPNHVQTENLLRKQIGTDFVKVKITKDGENAFVVEKNPNEGINLEYYKINNSKITYQSRVDTIEYGEIPRILELPNSMISYLSHNLTAPEDSGYWMVIYDYFKNVQRGSTMLATIHNWQDAYIPVYEPDRIDFYNSDYYIDISHPESPVEIVP